MKVILAKHAGFCWGVRRAVELALATGKKETASGGCVYTDGPLIHNRHEVERLAASGVHECKTPEELPPGTTLLIRAHGISPERRAALTALRLSLVDATCPNVARIQKICADAACAHSHIVILGDRDHAEVIGLLGSCAGRGFVVSAPEDIQNGNILPETLEKPVFVSQTTQSEALFEQTAEAMLRRCPDTTVIRTICNATRDRQGELSEIAGQCEKIVVVGSPASANTGRLAQLSAALRPTLVIESAADLKRTDFDGVTSVGLTAGASTPDSVIRAVHDCLTHESFAS